MTRAPRVRWYDGAGTLTLAGARRDRHHRLPRASVKVAQAGARSYTVTAAATNAAGQHAAPASLTFTIVK